MQSANDALAHNLSNSKSMLHRFTDDLKSEEFLHRPTAKANCAAWLIGHLALGDRRLLTLLGAGDLPALPAGFEKQFSRDERVCAIHPFHDHPADRRPPRDRR